MIWCTRIRIPLLTKTQVEVKHKICIVFFPLFQLWCRIYHIQCNVWIQVFAMKCLNQNSFRWTLNNFEVEQNLCYVYEATFAAYLIFLLKMYARKKSTINCMSTTHSSYLCVIECNQREIAKIAYMMKTAIVHTHPFLHHLSIWKFVARIKYKILRQIEKGILTTKMNMLKQQQNER